MPSNPPIPEPYFLAYFDEAGDPGVKSVAPIDPNGASEWFTVGCVVLKVENERLPVELIKRLKDELRSSQRPDLHFRHLSEPKKLHVCTALANERLRAFVLVSNKKNMRHYRNANAEALSLHPNNWFYNYCIRILLERVSEWCELYSKKHEGAPRHVKLIFSKRGGHSYRHVQTYTELLGIQAHTERLYQQARSPKFSVLDHRLIDVIQHEQNAGCQLADIVASAFYQAANTAAIKKWTTDHAKALRPRIARIDGCYANEGLTLLPWRHRSARLSQDQKEIFHFYGYEM